MAARDARALLQMLDPGLAEAVANDEPCAEPAAALARERRRALRQLAHMTSN